MQTLVFHAYRDSPEKSAALAYMARFLASQGQTVGVLDLDLESPCMHYLLLSDAERARLERGLIDDLLHFVEQRGLPPASGFLSSEDTAGAEGKIILLPAGAAPKGAYFQRLAELRKRNFLHEDDAAIVPLLLELKERFEQQWSPAYLLIHTHSGVSELGGIALAALADTALCFVDATPQSTEGTSALVHGLARVSRLPGQDPLQIVPVACHANGEGAAGDLLAQLHAALLLPPGEAPFRPAVQPPIALGSMRLGEGASSGGALFGSLLSALFPALLESALHKGLAHIAPAILEAPDAALLRLETLVESLPHPLGYRVLLQLYRFKGQYNDKTLRAARIYSSLEPQPDPALLGDVARGCMEHGIEHPTLATWTPAGAPALFHHRRDTTP